LAVSARGAWSARLLPLGMILAVAFLRNVPLPWLCAGRFDAIQGGFLRCALAAAAFGRWRSLHPNLVLRVGANRR